MDKTTDRIKADAEAKYNLLKEHAENEWDLKYAEGFAEGWHEGATTEVERLQPVIDALTQFIARHEGGLLPDRFTYEKGVKAIEQWKGTGKEVGDV